MPPRKKSRKESPQLLQADEHEEGRVAPSPPLSTGAPLLALTVDPPGVRVAPRVRWRCIEFGFHMSQELVSPIKADILSYQSRIPGVTKYAAGAQSAETLVQSGLGAPAAFETRENKHSEMMAIEHMLQTKEWDVMGGAIRTGTPPRAIAPAEFSTPMQHCGYCTLFLYVLELPLTSPSAGNYNLALNCCYPLPDKIKTDPCVLCRIRNPAAPTDFSKLKEMLNHFLNMRSDEWVLCVNSQLYTDRGVAIGGQRNRSVVTWEEIVTSRRSVLEELWRSIFYAIYLVNSERDRDAPEARRRQQRDELSDFQGE